MSEKDLVKGLKYKEPEALNFLYDQYWPALYGITLKIVIDPAMAAKVLENSFTKTCITVHSFNQSTSSFFIWLVRIVVEQCSKILKQPREVVLEKLGYKAP